MYNKFVRLFSVFALLLIMAIPSVAFAASPPASDNVSESVVVIPVAPTQLQSTLAITVYDTGAGATDLFNTGKSFLEDDLGISLSGLGILFLGMFVMVVIIRRVRQTS